MTLAHARGRKGEEAALKYFNAAGYCFLRRNFRVRADQPLSEIDLILLALQEDASEQLRRDFASVILHCNINAVSKLDSTAGSEPLLKKLIAQHSACLSVVFVEVKNWSSYPIADLCYNLSANRQRRMFQTAECFLQRNPQYASLVRRFDLVIFRGKTSQLEHIRSAFP